MYVCVFWKVLEGEISTGKLAITLLAIFCKIISNSLDKKRIIGAGKVILSRSIDRC